MPLKVVALASVDGETLSPEEAAARWEAKKAATTAAKQAAKAAKRLRSMTNDGEAEGDGRDGGGDPYDALFDAAQAQLQDEMASAGMGGMLPLSFGGSRYVGRPRSKRRRRVDADDDADVEVDVEAGEAGGDSAPAPVKVTKLVDKVRLTYDSDGEVAAREVERVEVEVQVQAPVVATEKEKKAAPPVAKEVRKFWAKRDVLFYKYSDGIELDHESWYSVTPQAIAEHIAARCRCDVVVDPFAGCGGNVIQLALTCRAVIAIDIDPDKIRMAKHNAAIYGVAHKIEFIVGDSMAILPTLQGADVVFLSPPWGGVKYNRKRFALDEMVVKGVSGSDLFAMARRVTRNVVYYLPKTTPVADLEALAPQEPVYCEMVVLNKTTSVMTAYYGDLAKLGDDA